MEIKYNVNSIHKPTMIQALEFVKAFIVINIIWTSDKICLAVADFLLLSKLELMLTEFQIIVNIFISLLVGVLTVVKIYKALKSPKEKEEKSNGEDEEN